MELNKTNNESIIVKKFNYKFSSNFQDFLLTVVWLSFFLFLIVHLNLSEVLSYIIISFSLFLFLFFIFIIKRNFSSVIFMENGIKQKDFIKNVFITWNEITEIKLNYYSTRRDNEKGWMVLSLNAKQKKIVISSESLNLIIERSSEDRKNLKNELYKIENFIGNKKKIDIKDLIKLTNLSENHSINKIVDLSLAKNTKQTLRALNENIFSAEDVIIIIRSYLIKSKRLLKLTEELEKNKNIDQVISAFKPPVFWKDKEIVKKQMAIWTKDKVKILIKNINNIELLLKKNTNSSINILRNFIIEQSSISNN